MTGWHYEMTARDPRNPQIGTWTIGVTKKKIELLCRKSHERKLAQFALVKEVIENTDGIVRGWSRPDTNEYYVYFGRPERDYRSATIDVPAPKNMYFRDD